MTKKSSGDNEMYDQIGKMTRSLHDTLRALGHDKTIEKTAGAIPDARERLAYVLSMTEQAASRVLNAVDAISPLQDKAQDEARALREEWQRVGDMRKDSKDYRATVERTRQFFDSIDRDSDTSKAQLMEIVMSQEFQDLTGQVIKKVVALAQGLESQLMAVLIEAIPGERRNPEVSSLLNGPVINADGRADVVVSQEQVDDLLGSLGF